MPACLLGTVPGRELVCDFAFAGLWRESFWPSALRHSATLSCLTSHYEAVMKSPSPQEAVRMVIIVIITFTRPVLCDWFHREMAHEIAKWDESSTLLFIVQDSKLSNSEETELSPAPLRYQLTQVNSTHICFILAPCYST